MMTFKQLEAIYWVARLGGFSAAASRLHTTQSAISKRIQELEDSFGTPLFDRTLRTARLTDKGEEMLQLASRLLAQRDAAVESFSRHEVLQRRLRLGVTELTAMTWLPRLVRQIQETYPKVIIEPDVDLSLSLRDKLLADEVDMIVVPDAFQDERFVATRAGSVASSWMCRPGLLDHSQPLPVQELARQRVLVQGDRSGTGILYNNWLQSLGIDMPSTVVSNNMIALIGMAVAGLGISYLPRQCLQPLVDNGSLVALDVEPALPQVKYMTMHRSELHSPLISAITAMVEGCCDFSQMFPDRRAQAGGATGAGFAMYSSAHPPRSQRQAGSW